MTTDLLHDDGARPRRQKRDKGPAVSSTEETPEAHEVIPVIDDSDAKDTLGRTVETAKEEDVESPAVEQEKVALIDKKETFDPTERKLSEDAFSFLIFSASWQSKACAVLVLVLQLLLFCLVAVDLYSQASKTVLYDERGRPYTHTKSSLGIPEGVEWQVKAAGFFAVVIAVLTQDDLSISLGLWSDHYSEGSFEAFQGAKMSRWLISSICRAVLGLLGLFVSLLLIVQSKTVLDLLLNFTAIEIVTGLDDVVFVLAQRGYFGPKAQEDAWTVSNTTYHVQGGISRNKRRWAFLLTTFALMVSLWAIAVKNQDLPPPPVPPLDCDIAGFVPFRLELDTSVGTLYATWDIVDANQNMLVQRGPYLPTDKKARRPFIVEQFCIPAKSCLTFSMRSSVAAEIDLDKFNLLLGHTNITTARHPTAMIEHIQFGVNCPTTFREVYCTSICGTGKEPDPYKNETTVPVEDVGYNVTCAALQFNVSRGYATKDECKKFRTLGNKYCCPPIPAASNSASLDSGASATLVAVSPSFFLVLAILALFLFCCCCRRRRQAQHAPQPNDSHH